MPLFARNLRSSKLVLAAGTGPPEIPGRGGSLDVTAALLGLTGPDYASIEVQRAAGKVRFSWTDAMEYLTGTLKVDIGAGIIHGITHAGDGPDPLAAASGSVAGLMSSTDKTKLDSVTAANQPTAGEKAALAGTSGAPGAGNKYTTDADARNTNARTPSTHAASHKGGGSDAIDIATGALSGLLSAADKTKLDAVTTANIPSAGEKAALAGTSGAPGAGNKYVTDADARNTNARTPAAHAASHVGGGSDAIAVAGAAHGLMSSTDKTKLDGIRAAATSALAHWGNSDVSTTTTTRFLSPGYDNTQAGTGAVQWEAPFPGTLKNLRMLHGTGAGNGNNIVYTLRKNGVATAITVTLASTGTAAQDTVNTVTVVAGDRIDIQVTKAATIVTSPSNITASLEITA